MWVRFALLGLLATLALAAAETDLEKTVEGLIEDFRAIMPSGRADIGIPVLEPAVIKEIPVSIKLSPFDAKCLASDIKVAGVSGFEFTRLEQLAGTTKLAVSVKLPDVAVDGEYDLQGKVKVGFINIKLNGKGPLKLTLQGLKGDATADVIVNEDGSLNLADLKIDDWSYDKITIKLENLLDGGVIGNTVNKLINKLVPTFVQSNRDKINAMVETMGKQVINMYLDGVAGKQSQAAADTLHAMEVSLSHEEWTVTAEVQDLLLQVAAAAADPAPSSSGSLVPRVSQLLEDFRKIMRTGRADMNIPVLEPAVIARMPVDIKLPPFDASAVSTDVHVAGVSQFKINKLEQVSGGTNRLFVDIEVPEVDVDAHYEITGSVKIGFLDFNLSGGKGPVTLKMKGFKGTATVDMVVNDDDSLNLNWIRFDSWNFDKCEAHMENVVMAKYVNPLVNKLIPVFMQMNRAWINNWGEGVAQTVVNRYLDGIAGKTVHAAYSAHSAGRLNKMAPAAFVVPLEAQQLLDQLALVLARGPRLAALAA